MGSKPSSPIPVLFNHWNMDTVSKKNPAVLKHQHKWPLTQQQQASSCVFLPCEDPSSCSVHAQHSYFSAKKSFLCSDGSDTHHTHAVVTADRLTLRSDTIAADGWWCLRDELFGLPCLMSAFMTISGSRSYGSWATKLASRVYVCVCVYVCGI